MKKWKLLGPELRKKTHTGAELKLKLDQHWNWESEYQGAAQTAWWRSSPLQGAPHHDAEAGNREWAAEL